MLASIPPIVLLVFGQRFITAGLIGGAVKEQRALLDQPTHPSS